MIMPLSSSSPDLRSKIRSHRIIRKEAEEERLCHAAILRKKEIFQKSSAALQDITASFTANTQSFVYMKKADFDSLLDKKTAMVLQ